MLCLKDNLIQTCQTVPLKSLMFGSDVSKKLDLKMIKQWQSGKRLISDFSNCCKYHQLSKQFNQQDYILH